MKPEIPTPESEAELARMIAVSEAPLGVIGGGTRVAVPGRAGLTTAGLKGITLYEPGALTLVARAGTPVAEVEAAVAAEGQRLAFEPMDHRALMGRDGTPTIGGMVAMNASGPRRVVAGAARDALLGIRAVDGTGTVFANGGRVMKNVTGYDLVRLFAGSRGRLGILTEISLKTLPRPEMAATLVARGLAPDRAVAAMSAALGLPYEVSGAVHDPAEDRTALRVEGFAGSVTYRAGKLAEALLGFGAWNVTEGPDPWPEWRDAADFAGGGDLWRVSTRPSAAAHLAARLPGRWRMDWGGGLIWAETPDGHDLRATLGEFSGHATLVRAAPETHDRFGTLPPETEAVAALSRGLVDRFDPKGLFGAAA